MKINTLECGSLPEELFSSLENGYSVYMTPCKSCGKTLISLKNSSDIGNSGNVTIYAFFHCECGAKFKRIALDLPGAKDGYNCTQGMVKKLIKPRSATNARGSKGKPIHTVDAYAVDFFFENRKKRYVVYPNEIKVKTPRDKEQES